MSRMPPMPWPGVPIWGATDSDERDKIVRRLYTADQIRERDRLIVEACAQICERMVSVSAVSYQTGSACAAALRSLLEQGGKE